MVPMPPAEVSVRASRDLRRQSVDEVMATVARRLGVDFDPSSMVRKRRSVGARTSRGTWVRIEVRPLAKIAEQGQAANGTEAAELLTGIAKPAWHQAVTWLDHAEEVLWRADEVDFVGSHPVRNGASLDDALALSPDWWERFNDSLDNLAAQHTTRVATPDTQVITQELVTATIDQAFPGTVDSTVPREEWVPAHADLNWANLTGPECRIIDWEDVGMAPHGLDAATLWVGSLHYPALADRVHAERRADLESRSGRIMALFYCAKILNDTSAAELPIYGLAAKAASDVIKTL